MEELLASTTPDKLWTHFQGFILSWWWIILPIALAVSLLFILPSSLGPFFLFTSKLQTSTSSWRPSQTPLLLCGLISCLLLVLLQNHLAREAERARMEGGKAIMQKEFTDWLSQAAMAPGDSIDMEFRSLKEFHRCKALEDVDEAAFHGIVENMARVLEISDDRKEEIQLARHASTMVNVIEDFEHGSSGFYTYGKYQTMKRANGNMDIVFAIHAFKWQLEEERSEAMAGTSSSPVLASGKARSVSMRERAVWKSHFRAEAMRLFEADCPQQLVTEMRLKERRQERQEAASEEDEAKRSILMMYEQARWRLEKEQILKEHREAKGDNVWGKVY